MRKLKLKRGEAMQILFEDLPDDNNVVTPEETDSEDDEVAVNPNQILESLANGGEDLLSDSEGSETQSDEENEERQGSNNSQDNTSSEDGREGEQPHPSTSAREKEKNLPNRKWKKRELTSVTPPFTKSEGIVPEHFVDCKSAVDYFLVFFQKGLVDHLIFQTNLYAVQRMKPFQPLTDSEFFTFIATNFLMGYHVLPAIKHYWCQMKDLNVALVAGSMTRERFKAILSFLHVNDNSKLPDNNSDKLYKLRPMIDNLNTQFSTVWAPSKNQSIDESMVRFKGRSSLKQYNPMKPIKRGYKIWCRAEMSGYTSEFEIYQGKKQASNDLQEKFGLGGRVIVELSACLAGNYHRLYFDNYFASISLVEYLKEKQILACGTIQKKRKGFPDLKADKMLKIGEFDWRVSKDDITVYKWIDNRAVHAISNFHGSATATTKRTQKDGSRLDVACPEAIRDYNANMGGVDKADMLRSCYGPDRKSRKWWHRIFFALLEMGLVNSYVAYCSVNEAISLLDYKRAVTMGLFTKGSTLPQARSSKRPSLTLKPATKRRRGFSVLSDVRLQNVGAHLPKFVGSRGRCEMCSMSEIECRPSSKCAKCDVFLCCNERKNCFVAYHTT